MTVRTHTRDAGCPEAMHPGADALAPGG